jgi:hypothetical protein
VLEASALSEGELGVYLRSKGIHAAVGVIQLLVEEAVARGVGASGDRDAEPRARQSSQRRRVRRMHFQR